MRIEMHVEQAIRHELAKIEGRIAWLTAELRRTEGQRDAIAAELTDTEGAHDRRFVGAR
jgi:uncharacterized small protein (DUF1192 family)